MDNSKMKAMMAAVAGGVGKPKAKAAKGEALPRMPKTLRGAGIKGGLRRKGEWELRKENTPVPGKPKDRVKKRGSLLVLPKEAMREMAVDKASGMTDREIGEKYAVSTGYVGNALRSYFTSSRIGKEILKGVLLDNALACGMKVRAQVDDLTPMQAVMATGIMTNKVIELEKATQNQQQELDSSELSQVGKMLRDMVKDAGIDDDSATSGGQIIDINANVDYEDD